MLFPTKVDNNLSSSQSGIISTLSENKSVENLHKSSKYSRVAFIIIGLVGVTFAALGGAGVFGAIGSYGFFGTVGGGTLLAILSISGITYTICCKSKKSSSKKPSNPGILSKNNATEGKSQLTAPAPVNNKPQYNDPKLVQMVKDAENICSQPHEISTTTINSFINNMKDSLAHTLSSTEQVTSAHKEMIFRAHGLVRIKIHSVLKNIEDRSSLLIEGENTIAEDQAKALIPIIKSYAENDLAISSILDHLRRINKNEVLAQLFDNKDTCDLFFKVLKEDKQEFLPLLGEICFSHGFFPIKFLKNNEIDYLIQWMYAIDKPKSKNPPSKIRSIFISSLVERPELLNKAFVLFIKNQSDTNKITDCLLDILKARSINIVKDYNKDDFSRDLDEELSKTLELISIAVESNSNLSKNTLAIQLKSQIVQRVNGNTLLTSDPSNLLECYYYATNKLWDQSFYQETKQSNFKKLVSLLPMLAFDHLETFFPDQAVRVDALKIHQSHIKF